MHLVDLMFETPHETWAQFSCIRRLSKFGQNFEDSDAFFVIVLIVKTISDKAFDVTSSTRLYKALQSS